MSKSKSAVKRRVVVTTEHRGVFFGTLKSRDKDDVELEDARNCIYWPAAVRGFLGLASVGPLDGSRVGPAVPTLTLTKVTAIVDCTDEAVKLWENGPWK